MDNLTTADFSRRTAKGKFVVDLWAEWCGPCRMLSPIIEDLSREMKGVSFAKVNVDEEPDIASRFGVRGIPTILILDNGEEIGRVVGYLPKEQLRKKLESAFD